MRNAHKNTVEVEEAFSHERTVRSSMWLEYRVEVVGNAAVYAGLSRALCSKLKYLNFIP